MSCYIRLRGLPWSVTHQEILDFLKNVTVVNGTKGIHMVLSRWDGKNTGEAFVELASGYDEKEAFKLNKLTLGHRYIEIFSATDEEVQHALKNPGSISSNVVKLRGLPYTITESEIENFFNGLNIKRGREGILIVMDRRDRTTGEAYVQFATIDDTEQALLRNKEKIGHRYIEIFRSSLAEMRRRSGNRPGPYDIKDRGGVRTRDDFGSGNNMNMLRDSGFGNNNKSGFGGGFNKSMGMNNSGNSGLSLGGFGLFDSMGGHSNGGNGGSGNNFGRSNNSMGLNFNSSTNFNAREKNFNTGLFWNNDLNKNNMGGHNGGNNGQNFDVKGGFNNDHDGGGHAFDRGNNGMNMGIGMLGGNKPNNDLGIDQFKNNRNFRNDNDLFCVHMRGLPYNTFENEVFAFFDPIRPVNVKIIFNNKGLHSGSADAYFYSYDDSQIAMKKHMEQIGNRYIELFFDGKTKGDRTMFSRQNNNDRF